MPMTVAIRTTVVPKSGSAMIRVAAMTIRAMGLKKPRRLVSTSSRRRTR